MNNIIKENYSKAINIKDIILNLKLKFNFNKNKESN